MNTEQMLLRLKHSGNKLTAHGAKKILSGEASKKDAKRWGGFFQSVIDGKYEDALNRADDENYRALTGDLT